MAELPAAQGAGRLCGGKPPECVQCIRAAAAGCSVVLTGTGVVAEQSTIVAHTETSLPSGVNKIGTTPVGACLLSLRGRTD
jgi:hypothetical protein